MNVAASTGSILANSIRAMATRTGALPSPATQWTAIVGPVVGKEVLLVPRLGLPLLW